MLPAEVDFNGNALLVFDAAMQREENLIHADRAFETPALLTCYSAMRSTLAKGMLNLPEMYSLSSSFETKCFR